ncbi:hypothetical protein Salat_0738600 [Sesamum alatum]|uniref:Uncharacterized protein n=1 Tax=Sesamum alatum TaxID=300844 RepID=A0AAE1YTH5_9LAMI|nr:hypothetical protein Salat_0738600 [Sesamum alatum]
MKRASFVLSQSHVSGDEAKAKLKYQTLLKEYLELQKEFVSRKRKLQAAKQKKETILAEVRFLRRRRKCLLKTQSPNVDEVPLHLPNADVESNALQGKGTHSTSEASPEKFDQHLLPNSSVKKEKGKVNEQVHEGEARFTIKLKNHLVHEKGVGKRKISWPDRVTLKV